MAEDQNDLNWIESSCKSNGMNWTFMKRQRQIIELNVHEKAKAMNWTFMKRQRQEAKICFWWRVFKHNEVVYRQRCSQKAKPKHAQNQKCLNKVPIKLQKVSMCLGHLNVPSTPWTAPENWVSDTSTRVWTWNQMTKKIMDKYFAFCEILQSAGHKWL